MPRRKSPFLHFQGGKDVTNYPCVVTFVAPHVSFVSWLLFYDRPHSQSDDSDSIPFTVNDEHKEHKDLNLYHCVLSCLTYLTRLTRLTVS